MIKEKFKKIDGVLTCLAIFMLFVNIFILFTSVFIYNDVFFLVEYQIRAMVLLLIVWSLAFLNLFIFDYTGGFNGKD